MGWRALVDTWVGDDDLGDGLHRLAGDAASGAALVDALAARRPGADDTTPFVDVVDAGSDVERVLTGVATAGDRSP